MFVIRRVVGKSMLPCLRPGQVIVGVRRFKKLSSGQVVIIRHNGLEKVKRVSDVKSRGAFVLGDNPGFSTDSREFGRIAPENVVAKVVWPKTRHVQ